MRILSCYFLGVPGGCCLPIDDLNVSISLDGPLELVLTLMGRHGIDHFGLLLCQSQCLGKSGLFFDLIGYFDP